MNISSLASYLYLKFKPSLYWKDILWQISGNGMAQAIGILGMPILTRLYAPEDFACLNLFTQVVTFLSGVMTFRYEYFIQLPKAETRSQALLRLVILLGGGMFIILTPLVWMLKDSTAYILGNPSLSIWIVWAPFISMVTSWGLALQHKAQRHGHYKISGGAEIINKGLYTISGVLGGVAHSSLGLIVAVLLGMSGKLVWLVHKRELYIIKNKELIEKNSYIFDLGNLKKVACEYSSLASAMVFSQIMMAFTFALPSIFIAHRYGPVILGNYTLVMSTLYLPSGLIGGAIGQVYYQRAALQWANGNSFKDIWRITVRKIILIGAPIYIAIACISPFLYPFIFGRAWKSAGYYATLISLSAFFQFISTPLDRSSLIVNAWWYLPSWHVFRVLTTIIVLSISWYFNLSFQQFLVMLVIQLALVYIIDFIMERGFSKLQPVNNNK